MSSARYRKVGHSSNIDESLFGTDSEKDRAIRSGANSTFSSSSNRNKSKKNDMKALMNNSIVVTTSELNKIKKSAIIKTEAELAADRDEYERILQEKQRFQKERKNKMIALGEVAKKAMKKSDVQVQKEAAEAQLRKAAGDLRDQDNDVVKLMNTLATRATAFTVRDAQLTDKEERDKEREEYERRMDTIMEIDRLRDIERREREESEKQNKRIEDRKVINDQIAERQRMRLIAAEAREQENLAMKALMAKYKEEDELKAKIRAEESAVARKETMAMNEEAITRKQMAREAVKKEMEDILIYQAMKDAEMLKREEEEAAIEQVKRDRQKLLLSQQEKALNRAGEMDELRARRAAEEHERRARKKERDEFMKRKNDTEELLRSRAKQAADKKSRLAGEKIFEEEEFANALRYMKQGQDREDRETAHKKRLNNEHRIKLNKQISDDMEARKALSDGNLDEGDKFRQELIRDEEKFKVIRDRMVSDLVSKGVNPRYLTEMKHLDVGKILKR